MLWMRQLPSGAAAQVDITLLCQECLARDVEVSDFSMSGCFGCQGCTSRCHFLQDVLYKQVMIHFAFKALGAPCSISLSFAYSVIVA